MNANLVYINPACRITRVRRLPAAGQVMVKNGQPVSTNEVIASIDMPDKHLNLDVSRILGLDRAQAARAIIPRPGDMIRKGEVIARRGGLLSKQLTSPVDGKVTDCSNARVLVELGSNPIIVQAGFTGIVKEVIPGYGAILVAEGAILQGVWGNGRLAEGLIISLVRNQVEELNPDRMDVSLRGSVVFGGPCINAETMRLAADIPLRGLIVSSIAPELLELAEKLPFPVVALIGLGKVPYDDHSYQIIGDLNKHVACINAVPWDRYSGLRPEVVVPRRGEGRITELPDNVEYTTGQLVRILQSPYLWEIARIKEIFPEARRYPSGIIADSALCELANGKETVQPLVNLEVIL